MIAWFLVYFFGLLTLILVLYSGYQLYLSLVCSQQVKAQKLQLTSSSKPLYSEKSLPLVTFQIALFNEGRVVDALFSSLLEIDYPKSLLEIQLLDDSTDPSIELNAAWVERLNAIGFKATHLTRQHRKGFKAGALNEGLHQAKGEFIAIFDADFNLPPNWLLQCLEGFQKPSVAAVQSRWTYGNAGQNLTTRLQVLALNHHFVNEHIARDQLHLMTTFNGTAALWKKSVILALGGFNTRTLTEDLNLAYRAQLAGYDLRYFAHITAESELPATPSAYFTQQFRWNKGAAENFRLLRTKLSRLKKRSVRFHAFMHLLGSTFYLASFFLLLTGLSPLLIWFSPRQLYSMALITNGLSVSAILLGIALFRAERSLNPQTPLLSWAIHFLLYLALSAGMSYMNARAVVEGHLGIRSAFVRTPKIKQFKERLKTRLKSVKPIEALIAIIAWAAFIHDIQTASFSLMGLHLFTALAFSWVCLSSWQQA